MAQINLWADTPLRATWYRYRCIVRPHRTLQNCDIDTACQCFVRAGAIGSSNMTYGVAKQQEEWSSIGKGYASSNYIKDNLELTNVKQIVQQHIEGKQGFRYLP